MRALGRLVGVSFGQRWPARERQPQTSVAGGLTRRMVVASALLAVIVGAAFVVLLLAIADLRRSERQANHSQEY